VLDWYAEVVFPSLSESEVFELRHAAALLQEALQIVPDDPQALFYLGLVTFVAGDRGVAVSILRKAAGFDRSPNNANDRSNDIVRSVAELHSGTRLLDADRVFRSRCPDDLVGYEVLMDACHLHPGARDALMMDMAKELLRMELR
jgi:tetratricopeptide (TPR) repeat protein